MGEQLTWIRSSHSDSEGGACVEVAFAPRIRIRDSKNPTGPELQVPASAWAVFISAVQPEA
ncbi:DUF397 domain-containing protein [Streptomyces pharetrae]|uniref:DUF397 domain-containing protein n=1 Tax=Streptomyces pharetrae CZA14 TaxID=1144883 RepID=A0ABX3YIC4_9ACTN|nr:hypothetical protein OQI_17450 [Streptomyces pharetrae CZA14]